MLLAFFQPCSGRIPRISRKALSRCSRFRVPACASALRPSLARAGVWLESRVCDAEEDAMGPRHSGMGMSLESEIRIASSTCVMPPCEHSADQSVKVELQQDMCAWAGGDVCGRVAWGRGKGGGSGGA
eukprot:1199115-Rhodomonas_salina.1